MKRAKALAVLAAIAIVVASGFSRTNVVSGFSRTDALRRPADIGQALRLRRRQSSNPIPLATV